MSKTNIKLLSQEYWKDLEGEFYGLFQISNKGRIRSHKRSIQKISPLGNEFTYTRKEMILKPHLNKETGYLQIVLQNQNGKQKLRYIHRLVGEAFVANPLNKPCINHLDGNKLHNHYSNIQWCTHAENTHHAIQHNLIQTALSEDDVIYIYNNPDRKKGTELAEDFGISPTYIYNIQRSENKAYITCQI